MIVSQKQWDSYIKTLRQCSDVAAQLVEKYWNTHRITSLHEWNMLIDYAYAASTRYGETAAAAACEMYDAIAAASGAAIPPAIPADTAAYGKVAASVREAGKSENGKLVAAAIDRLVKAAAVDTTIGNAKRDGAEFAWIPAGRTCAFCLTLASRGWQRQSAKAKRSHATHIHAHCNCSYAVRFNSDDGVAGYDPDKYLQQYNKASSSNDPEDKINALRRQQYASDREEINAQKREAYRLRQERRQQS